MKTAVLFIAMFLFAGCVSTNTFNALQKKVNEMEDVQKLNTIVLAKTVKAVEANEGDILELAKAANFFFKQLQDAHNQMMIAQAGVMQNNKDLADLDEKVEKLGKYSKANRAAIQYLHKRLVLTMKTLAEHLVHYVMDMEKQKKTK